MFQDRRKRIQKSQGDPDGVKTFRTKRNGVQTRRRSNPTSAQADYFPGAKTKSRTSWLVTRASPLRAGVNVHSRAAAADELPR